MKHGGLLRLAWLLAIVLMVSLFPSACAKNYILVRVEKGSMTQGSGKAEVSETEIYKSTLNNIKVMSIRMPDTCATESAALAQGKSSKSDVLMLISCAVWLGELERSLVARGYRVVSWDAINRLERTKNISTYIAAQELGIDVVVMINSLEANPTRSGGLSEAAITYQWSNPNGEPQGEASLPTRSRNAIKATIEQRYLLADASGYSSLSGTLDATAVYVKSGEAMWFYRRNITRDLIDLSDFSYLFRGRDIYYRPVKPRTLITDSPGLDVYASTEVQYQKKTAESEDPYKQIKLSLIRDVANDFVSRFRSGIK